MHGTAQQIYRALGGRQRGIFLKAYARLNGDEAVRAIDPEYGVRAMAQGMRSEACAVSAVPDAQAVPGSDREGAGGGCLEGTGGRGAAAVWPATAAGGARCS